MPTTVTDRLFGENSSVAVKAPVVAVASTAIALSGLAAIPTAAGNYTPNTGDRILVPNQADPTQNGIYNASTAAWTRTGDFDGANDVVQGTLVCALLGAGSSLAFYQLTTANPVIGTTPLNFSPLASNPNLTYPQTAAEVNAGVTPANTTYLPGDFRRYGGDPTAISSNGTFNSAAADSTAAILSAFLTGHTVLGGGRNCGYKCSQSIPLTNNMDFDAQDCTIYWTADVAAFTNTTGAAVLYPNVRGRLRAKSNVASTHAMLDLVDVNRGYFDIAQVDRGVASMSWGYAIRIRTSVSTALWNKIMPMEVDAVNTGAISIENANCNQNVVLGFKLINDASILLPYGVKITGGGDNSFFDLDLEASFSTNGGGSAYGVNFNTGTNNKIYGLRTEGYANAASFFGVNYAGTAGDNEVYGHYYTGFGASGAFSGLVAGNTYVGAGYAYFNAGSITGLKGEVAWDSVADRIKGTTNAGGTRLMVQSPALDNLNMNGSQITNVAPNTSGWGTPTGATVVANFPGASATLVQCSEAIAAIINALKAQGNLGA